MSDFLEAGTMASLCADPDVNLLPFGRRSRMPRWGRWLNLALAGLAGLLLLTAVFTPLVQQRRVVAALRVSVDQAHQQAEAVADLDKKINGFIEESQFLIQSRDRLEKVIGFFEYASEPLQMGNDLRRFDRKDKMPGDLL